ncbi:MAG: ABC transporter substrate-binding protein [candidate division WOR-3 bacterium]
MNKKAITKVQAAIIAVVVIIIASMTYYYISLLGPTPTLTLTPTPTPTPTPLRTVRVAATATGLVFAPIFLADELGFFKEEGLDIRYVWTGAVVITTQAILSGDAEFAIGHGALEVPKLIAEGQRLTMIMGITTKETAIWLVQDKYKDRVKTPLDMKGLSVGVTRPGGGTWALAVIALKKYGLSPEDVTWVSLGGDPLTVVGAYEAGQVDSIIMPEHIISLAKTRAGGFELIDFTKPGDSLFYLGSETLVSTTIYTRPSLLVSDPELCKKFLRVMLKALNYINMHTPQEIAEVLAPRYKEIDREILVKVFERYKYVWSKDGIITKEAYEAALNNFYGAGLVRTIVRYEDAVNLMLLREVLEGR